MIWRDANFISNLCAHSYSNLGFFSPARRIDVRPVRSFWPNADIVDPDSAIRRRPGRVLHCRRLRDLLAGLHRPDQLLFWL